MMTFTNNIPKKYEIGFDDFKYGIGVFNFLYFLKRKGMLARVSKDKIYLDFSISLAFHIRDISKKLNPKGYLILRNEEVYMMFHRDLELEVPGVIIEEMKEKIMLKNVQGMHAIYFRNYYREILNSVKKEWFVVEDNNEENFLCNLKNKKRMFNRFW